MLPSLKPAIFLDRDGVVIENRAEYVRSIAEVRFIPGAREALARLARSGYAIVIVTNQSAIGRGLMARDTADAINAHLVAAIESAGGRVDGLYLCPHRPDEHCLCRKPAPGLLLDAARDLGLDLAASVMIGDALTDVQAAQAAGAQSLLVLSGRGSAEELNGAGLFHIRTAPDLAAAIKLLSPLPTKTPPG